MGLVRPDLHMLGCRAPKTREPRDCNCDAAPIELRNENGELRAEIAKLQEQVDSLSRYQVFVCELAARDVDQIGRELLNDATDCVMGLGRWHESRAHDGFRDTPHPSPEKGNPST
jgi:hypothetical protein